MQDAGATVFIILSGILGLIFALVNYLAVAKTSLQDSEWTQTHIDGDTNPLTYHDDDPENPPANPRRVMEEIRTISTAIAEGANSFLLQEYMYMGGFIVVFALILLFVIGGSENWTQGIFSMLAFILGSVTSMASGFIGMRIAVFGNSRTAVNAVQGVGPAFVCAFKSGAVMGFALVSLGLLNLFICISLFRAHFGDDVKGCMEAIASYGLGGSSIALFGRVAGGIYTKAADVGADLVGKVEQNIPEDDPRNPAVIADNVGDNVGDVAGMGSDLFGSFAESSCAALVIAATDGDLKITKSWAALMFPLMITAGGIIVSAATTFIATHVLVVKDIKDIEPSLKRQLVVSTALMTPVLYVLSVTCLPAEFTLSGGYDHVKNWQIFFTVATGLWSGLLIGFVTEYYTSHSYGPVKEVAYSCRTGAATNIIYGLALGYKSVIVPVLALAVTIYVGFTVAGMYGIALSALGILSTLAIGLTIDCYGPVSDNAGGIAEMAGMGAEIRHRTDALDAAGNTTAAIGKGFAIGSAALVSLALFGGFTSRASVANVNIMKPYPFAGLLVGAMLPYWFSAMTMKSVGMAALAMVEEVREQFRTIPGLMDGTGRPDYRRCVKIATDASLKEMIAPGALVMLSPLVVGFFFGKLALAGLLAGALVSGVQMAISSSNTGGAWDNAKKYIEAGAHGGKGTDVHAASVIGDTVGDPLKDTSGPALNILIKLMAILSLVFAGPIAKGGGFLAPSDQK